MGKLLQTVGVINYLLKNIFMVTTGKEFIDEISKFLNLWTNNTPLKNIALTAIQVVPALLQNQVKHQTQKKRQFKNIRKKSEIMRRREYH